MSRAARRVRGLATQSEFYEMMQFGAFWSVFCNNYDIYSFEKMLTGNAHFRKYNVNNCVFSIDGVNINKVRWT